MLLKTLALAFLCAASALPQRTLPWGGDHSRAHAPARICKETYAPTGQYIDEGCGVTIQTAAARNSGALCVRVPADTKAGDAAVLAPCLGLTQTGGRWDMLLGRTQLRNMQASRAGFCLAVNGARDGVEMQKCANNKEQAWVTTVTSRTQKTTLGTVQWHGSEKLCLANPASSRNAREIRLEKCTGAQGQVWAMAGLGEPTAG